MEKERAVPPDTMLCPARFARSLKRRGRFTSDCVSGRSQSSPRRALCKGGQSCFCNTPWKAPSERLFWGKRISACVNPPQAGEFWNSRKTSSERGYRLFRGVLSFRPFLWTSKEKDIELIAVSHDSNTNFIPFLRNHTLNSSLMGEVTRESCKKKIHCTGANNLWINRINLYNLFYNSYLINFYVIAR